MEKLRRPLGIERGAVEQAMKNPGAGLGACTKDPRTNCHMGTRYGPHMAS